MFLRFEAIDQCLNETPYPDYVAEGQCQTAEVNENMTKQDNSHFFRQIISEINLLK